MSKLMLFTGNAHPELANKVAKHLHIPLGNAQINCFSDGEISTEILENVRGNDVFILQPTCSPANDHLMEVMILADALRRSSAGRITAVIPYYGYARQDRRTRSSRVPITAKVVADMLAGVGINRVMTVDIHAEQIQGFFHIPHDNVYGSPVLLEHVLDKKLIDPVVVSPDVGGVARARGFAKRLNNADLAIIDKRRPRANEARIMHIIGDVKGRDCILVDDIVDTAGTLCKAAEALREHGATNVSAYCVHPVLSGNAIANIENSSLTELVVTDTIPLSEAAKQCVRIKQLSLAPMLSEAIRRVCHEESISSMFIE
ncbi:Ribose-phosphate pyrophosphokinase [Piscirickettsia salmonis]|uniref:Ribose-phosphate pyrophosphokinase n=2 Tax=Piscirickettsia salmonis TaxID=1238 RepID=A0AAC8VJ65_PISSA|nr:ribose-phosphate pyrophosphokinase [Piscirickettsia salmonis]AKP74532.2 ribose-phosphate pyrophosphokinase [Piscirickettsia salmonis LF-89 = ATCC VR-1361]ALB23513.1 ribose-phosphate pyrophosphokinase [Piscirickettsia salmonis]APS76361.1 ribose-phosphate pyrophosphokinase [Piscirickettsia salmonis]KLV36442.1 ribose-phosphate pyrophosphokinase [Piscirickettsia salmonis]QGN97893.1 Ribose-phosphate pyrophosphokinase [Piscirickettsia salmonis]